jgi:hypothetical protein
MECYLDEFDQTRCSFKGDLGEAPNDLQEFIYNAHKFDEASDYLVF